MCSSEVLQSQYLPSVISSANTGLGGFEYPLSNPEDGLLAGDPISDIGGVMSVIV